MPTPEDLQHQIDQLRRENYQLNEDKKRLNFQLKRAADAGRFGLHWLDVPEDFGPEAANALPILKEVKDRAVSTPDGKPTHVLIEGENYHALQCLSYTHKGKVDVIYIDPPYNTGNDGFRYRDKRLLEQYPDGSPVPKDSPLRHSYWLSFMHKRLELAKNLLRDSGVIFISIDDNEQAQLKLLCDEVFGEENFVANVIWQKRTSPDSRKILGAAHDHIYTYCKNIEKKSLNLLSLTLEQEQQFKNPDSDPNGPWVSSDFTAQGFRPNQMYKIITPGGTEYVPPEGRCWKNVESVYKQQFKAGRMWFGKDGKGIPRRKTYLLERKGAVPWTWWDNKYAGSNQDAKKELIDILHDPTLFDTPKPLELVKKIASIAAPPNATILDFFAGSGTTLHATLALNEQDGGNRQCILVTNNENNIAEEVCYERNRRVMQGYTNAKGQAVAPLGNSLNYYRVGFVGKNHPQRANDEDLLALAYHAGELLALAENTLHEIRRTDAWQLFTNQPVSVNLPVSPKPVLPEGEQTAISFDTTEPQAASLPAVRQYTAIYFQEDLAAFEPFCAEVQALTGPVTVYVFSWGEGEFDFYFVDYPTVVVKTIPQPILDIYRNITTLTQSTVTNEQVQSA